MPELPAMSIVVPNYNGGKALARALQSLIDQGYPNLQIVVVDGGSTDNSVEVIRQFERHIDWWVSEADHGQSQAINKGFARCTGEVCNWLCSDDWLARGALKVVGEAFAQDPDLGVLVGACDVVRPDGTGRPWPMRPVDGDVKLMPCTNRVPQPSCFYRRRLLDRPGPIREDFHYSMDFELWMYFKSRGAKWRCIDTVLSVIESGPETKTRSGGLKVAAEWERVYRAYTHEAVPLTFWNNRIRTPLLLARSRHPGGMLKAINIAALWAFDWLLTPFYGYWRVRVMDWSAWHAGGN